MELLTKPQRAALLATGLEIMERDTSHLVWPKVKLFTPDAGARWLLAWLEPEDEDTAWGLCDLGVGYPEIGSVSMSEIADVRGAYGLPVERDLFFRPLMSLLDYAAKARDQGRITA